MDKEILQDMKTLAKQDFNLVKNSLNRKQKSLVASVKEISYEPHRNSVLAKCTFTLKGDRNFSVESSIKYESINGAIYANKTISDVANRILGNIDSKTSITAAEEDDEFNFDDFDDEPLEDEDSTEEAFEEADTELENEEYEDPEEDVSIETDNNIEGHYIVECNRCHGIFISALVESDQVVEYVSGVCPLCQKESDQYVKWVVKPVEF